MEHLAGDVGPEAVGEVAAGVERHAHQPLAAELGAQPLPLCLGEIVDVLRAHLGERDDGGGNEEGFHGGGGPIRPVGWKTH